MRTVSSFELLIACSASLMAYCSLVSTSLERFSSCFLNSSACFWAEWSLASTENFSLYMATLVWLVSDGVAIELD